MSHQVANRRRIKHCMTISAAAATMLFASTGMADKEEETQEAGRALLDETNEPNPKLKSFTITFNPITALTLKLGPNLEYLPTRHHAIVLNPFIWGLPPIFGALGMEAGYHHYSGNAGADGFYIGPSIIVYTGCILGYCGNSIEFALDIGGQHIFDNGFTIGGGLRLFTTSGRKPASAENKRTVVPWPLFTIGYSM